MSLFAAYHIFPDYALILHYFEGEVTINTLVEFRKEVFTDPDFRNTYSSLNDFRNTEFQARAEHIKKFISFEKQKSSKEPRKISLLTNTPNQVVTSKLYELYNKDVPVLVQISTTFSAATLFLGLTEEASENIKQTITNLKTQLKEYRAGNLVPHKDNLNLL